MNVKTPAVQTIDSLRAKTVEEGDCWLWTGPTHEGRARVSHEGRLVYARRLMQQLAGKSVQGVVTTTCDNPLCLNPDHLATISRAAHQKRMTAASNTGTVLALKSAKVAQTKRQTTAKLTLEQARAIRVSDDSTRVLSERYGVNRRLVYRIRMGLSWREHGNNPFAGLMR